MRKILLAIAAAGLVALLTTAPAPAAVRTLHAHRVVAEGSWIGPADATTAAYSRPGVAGVVLRADGGASRRVTAPDGCQITAAGGGLLASACGLPTDLHRPGGPVMLHLAVSRLDGSLVTRFDAEGQGDPANASGPGAPAAVGAQWVRLPNGAKQAGSWWEDVNWRTGEVRESLQTDAAKVDDLDLPGLQAPLCSPLKRVWRGNPDMSNLPGFFSAELRGRWVLLEGATGFTLHHCGLARPVTLPKAFRPWALGDGWVAGYEDVAHRSPRLELIRLSDRRLFPVAGVPGSITRLGDRQTLAFTRGRLYAYGDAGIFTVTLPRR
jgi:hypothetical protein